MEELKNKTILELREEIESANQEAASIVNFTRPWPGSSDQERLDDISRYIRKREKEIHKRRVEADPTYEKRYEEAQAYFESKLTYMKGPKPSECRIDWGYVMRGCKG